MSWKNLVLQLWLKIFSMNQPEYSFIKNNICKESINTFLVGYGLLYLLSNQMARFFGYQYLWREPIYFFFLHGDIHLGKVASETTTFGWVWLGVPLFQSDCVILDHECHCKESIHVNQLTSEATTFGGT